MRVIDQDTGKYCHLDVTSELKAELARHDAAACKHPEREVRQRLRSNGALHLYEQCLSCGASVGLALKRSPEFANAPAWNEGHEEHYNAARETEREAIIQKHVRKQKTGAEGVKREYDVYLSSPEWQAKLIKLGAG